MMFVCDFRCCWILMCLGFFSRWFVSELILLLSVVENSIVWCVFGVVLMIVLMFLMKFMLSMWLVLLSMSIFSLDRLMWLCLR